MAGSCGTSHIQLWELHPKMGVPDLRKTPLPAELQSLFGHVWLYSKYRQIGFLSQLEYTTSSPALCVMEAARHLSRGSTSSSDVYAAPVLAFTMATTKSPQDGSLATSTASSELISARDLSIVAPPRCFTHDATLPNTSLPLDQALSNFDDALSPWKYPLEWMNAEANHVQSIANDFTEMIQIGEIETLLHPGMIYQVSGVGHYPTVRRQIVV